MKSVNNISTQGLPYRYNIVRSFHQCVLLVSTDTANTFYSIFLFNTDYYNSLELSSLDQYYPFQTRCCLSYLSQICV